MFWKKRSENVDLTLKEEIDKLKTRLTKVEAEILDVATAQDVIRNKVLRKIQSKKPAEDEEETQNIYNKVLIPEPYGSQNRS